MCGRGDSRLDQRQRIFLRSCLTGNSNERFMCGRYNVFSENQQMKTLFITRLFDYRTVL